MRMSFNVRRSHFESESSDSIFFMFISSFSYGSLFRIVFFFLRFMNTCSSKLLQYFTFIPKIERKVVESSLSKLAKNNVYIIFKFLLWNNLVFLLSYETYILERAVPFPQQNLKINNNI